MTRRIELVSIAIAMTEHHIISEFSFGKVVLMGDWEQLW